MAVRKPRILAALPPARPETVVPTVPMTRRGRPRGTTNSSRVSQETGRVIPKSQLDRVRAWLKYGMTARQAANVCGVSVSELKDALATG
jgi:hypothetical protein